MVGPTICVVSGHEFGYRALTGILESTEFAREEFNVRLLVSLSPRKEASTVGYRDFVELARRYSIAHRIVESVKDDSVEADIRRVQPDFLLVIGWSELVPRRILGIPAEVHGSDNRHSAVHGCIGMHPTLLPEGRGRAPIPWTIIKGLRQTGVTTFLLEDTADSGGVILQIRLDVDERETATTLFQKCAQAHYESGKSLASMLASGSLQWTEQKESDSTVWSKRRPQDGAIDFHDEVNTIERLVRALTAPYPGAFFKYGGTHIRINAVEAVVEPHGYAAGTVVGTDKAGRPIISARGGFIRVVDYEWLNGKVVFRTGEVV